MVTDPAVPRLPAPRVLRAVLLPLAVFAALAWLALAIADRMAGEARQQASAAFETASDSIVRRIEARMDAYAQVLRGAAGLLVASERVSRPEFRRYVAALDLPRSYPGIQGVGFARRLVPGEREALEAAVRAEGFPGFAIHPAGERAEMTGIVFLEPFDDRNQRAFGYDMYAEPVRRAAMARARDTGAASLSGPVRLLQETGQDEQPGVLLYLPVYRIGAPTGDEAARREALLGYAYSPFRMHDLMRGVLGEDWQDIEFEVRDAGAPGAGVALFGGHPAAARDDREAAFRATREVDMFGRRWAFALRSPPAAVAIPGLGEARMMGGAGLLIALLLGLLVAILARTRVRAEQLAEAMTLALRRSEHHLRTLLDELPALISFIDAGGRYGFANRRYPEWWGIPSERVVGHTPRELFGPVVADRIEPRLAAALAGEPQEFEQVMPDGRILEVRYVPSRSGTRVEGVHVMATDISAAREMAERMAHLAQHDPLTDLPNRVLLQDRLGQAIARAARNRHGVGLLFVDLDQFKRINDSLGHAVGDRLLQEVARRLLAMVRPDDTVSRQGGDEFVVLLDRLRRPEDAGLVAEKVLRAFADPVVVDGHTLFVGLSIGIALAPQDSDDPGQLFKQADTAMYHAKQQGRGRYCYFDADMGRAADRRLSLETALRQALREDQLQLAYQPRVHCTSGRLAGFEALLRWNREDGTPVSPAEFIPLAEESGLILEIDAWVLREACRQSRAWADAGLPALPVAVNVSLAHFDPARLLAAVTGALAAHRMDPALLELEITETQMLRDPEGSREALEKLRRAGVRIAIDDFGTGYSSLGYLQDLPADIIKIDRSFVAALPGSARRGVIVSAVIAIARAMKLRVIAEGVELEAQAAFVCDKGADEMQGFLFARAVPAAEAAALLDAEARGEPLCALAGRARKATTA